MVYNSFISAETFVWNSQLWYGATRGRPEWSGEVWNHVGIEEYLSLYQIPRSSSLASSRSLSSTDIRVWIVAFRVLIWFRNWDWVWGLSSKWTSTIDELLCRLGITSFTWLPVFYLSSNCIIWLTKLTTQHICISDTILVSVNEYAKLIFICIFYFKISSNIYFCKYGQFHILFILHFLLYRPDDHHDGSKLLFFI